MAGRRSSAPPSALFLCTAAVIECLQQSTRHANISNALLRVVITANEWTASEMADSVERSF